MRNPRSSGVLLHVSSLPGGKLGREAFRFVDWLVEAGQSWWALLPLGPPDWAGSPYSSSSAFAAHRGVRMFGDIPIYVAARGADVEAHPELFQEGVIAGAPPDALSSVGQLWGNPLYDWRELQAQGYRWWLERLRRTFELYDLARIDHFRGFVSYWSVPAGRRTAKRGRWR